MKFVLALLVASASATSLRQMSSGPAFTDAWREPTSPGAAAKNACVNANKTGFGSDQSCDTAGNSAWNTHTTARTGSQSDALGGSYPDHALHVQLLADMQDPWREPLSPGAAATNACVNANKTAFGSDQSCDTAGNSAWNTHTTSRTGSQTAALTGPYPDHTLH